MGENEGKLGRGRPRLLSEVAEAVLRRNYGGEVTRRTLQNADYQNVAYMGRAMRLLEAEHPRFSYLVDKGRVFNPQQGADWGLRFTVLAALGRIEDDDLLREVAELICEHRMKNARALTFIRRCRAGDHPGEVLSLFLHLSRALNAFLERYPETDPWVIRRAIHLLGEEDEPAISETVSDIPDPEINA